MRRPVEALSFYQTSDLFENNDGNDDGVLSFFYFLENTSRSFA
jgi:hypothetical protein